MKKSIIIKAANSLELLRTKSSDSAILDWLHLYQLGFDVFDVYDLMNVFLLSRPGAHSRIRRMFKGGLLIKKPIIDGRSMRQTYVLTTQTGIISRDSK